MAIDDSYTKVLLHMDGSDGSTDFTDESGKSWTANGSAQIDTAQYKFGGASGLFNKATSDYLSTPHSTDFDFGTGNWTIELFVRRNGTQDEVAGLVATSKSGALTSGYVLSWSFTGGVNKLFFAAYMNGWGIKIYGASVIPDLTWTHVAVVRNGNEMKLYVAGTADGTYDCTGQSLNTGGFGMVIARNHINGTPYYNGWIDEVRISKGIARYTSNFTPPVRSFAPMSSVIKTINGVQAIKTVCGVSWNDIKSIQGLT